MTIFGLWLIGIGSLCGAIGSSSMFWTKRGQKQVEVRATKPSASARSKRRKQAKAARVKLENREVIRDRMTQIGWGFVLVGSGFSIIGAYRAATKNDR